MKMRLLILTLLSTLLALTPGRAATVAWGNTPFDPLPLIDNDGNALDSSYQFELGTFANGFIPTATNFALWAANWKQLGVAAAPDHWVTDFNYFYQSIEFNTNGTVADLPGSATFSAGEQAYLWVHSGVQWALVTDTSPGSGLNDIWQLPDPANTNVENQADWVLSNANVVIMGGVNGIQSGTSYAYDPGSNFRIQMAVIPEPGSCLLVLLAGCLARFHRFRRR